MTDILIEKISEIASAQARIMANQDNDRKLLEKHSEKLENYNIILTRNTVTVEDHHKRSLHLENRQDEVEDRQTKLEQFIATQKAKKQGVKELLSQLGIIVSASTAVGGALWGIFEFIKSLGV